LQQGTVTEAALVKLAVTGLFDNVLRERITRRFLFTI
jgi:hypothetical protein